MSRSHWSAKKARRHTRRAPNALVVVRTFIAILIGEGCGREGCMRIMASIWWCFEQPTVWDVTLKGDGEEGRRKR